MARAMNSQPQPPLSPKDQKHTGLKHYFLLIVGAIMFSAGMIFIWTPIPIGMPLIAFGSIILIRESRHFRSWLRSWRERNAVVDRFFLILQAKLPSGFARPLKRTNPDPSPGAIPPEEKSKL